MTTFPIRPHGAFRRLLGVSVALVLLATLAPGARAITSEQVKRAEAEAKALLEKVRAQQAVVVQLQQQANALADELSREQTEYEGILEELRITQERIDKAEQRYENVRGRLDERAREAYINGPGNNFAFLLGSDSIADLTDRLQFLDSLSQNDSDIANEIEDLHASLEADKRKLEDLKAKQAKVLESLNAKQDALNAKMGEQQSALNQIEVLQAKADALAKKLGKEYKQQLAAAFGGKIGNGVLRVCPVGMPHSYGDSFGAPRYGGGYHLHKGVDIFAATGTPIYATFDGYARDASNGLGGMAVIVEGAPGYTYNAHLSRMGQLGQVGVGDVVGYVGNSGDAIGTSPHDHFEFHPKSIPSDWPKSGYGYAVIDDAINPYPLLQQVC